MTSENLANFKERIKLELGDKLFDMTTFVDMPDGATAKIKDYGIEIDWEKPKRGKWNPRQYWKSPKTRESIYWDICDCKWCDPNVNQLRQDVLRMINNVDIFCVENHDSKQLKTYWYENFDIAYNLTFAIGAMAFVLLVMSLLCRDVFFVVPS